MTIRTLIVDDEPLARRGLEIRLQREDDVVIIGECSNGREAIEKIREHQPDLVFLDIQMPGIGGFDVIQALEDDELPIIVFVTAFDQYALQAFEVHALDYLLKPIDDSRLQESLVRIRETLAKRHASEHKKRLIDFIVDMTGEKREALEEKVDKDEPLVAESYPDKLAIKDGSDITCVNMSDIEWIDAAGDYMCIHALGETHIMRRTMKELEKELDPKLFQRVHRSIIVNTAKVQKLSSHKNGEYHLILENGTQLKMSRSYKDKVKLFFPS